MKNEFNANNFEKAPPYFLVHLKERFTSISSAQIHGKPYPLTCDGVTLNVYGFQSQEEANVFNPLLLRKYLNGSRAITRLFAAETREIASHDVFDFLNKQKGALLINETVSKPIEELPRCDRMYTNTETGELLCGKPTNEYHDGCCGGCVLDGSDQEFDPEYIVCPMQKYWAERIALKEQTE